MENFDKGTAIDMIEDALEAVDDPIGRGIALGLCSAFYVAGTIETGDWQKYEKRILESPLVIDCDHCPAGTREGSRNGPTPPDAAPWRKTPTG